MNNVAPKLEALGKTETHFCTITKPGTPLRLQSGQSLAEVTLAYETYGALSPRKDNALLVFHALSGSQHAAGYNPHVREVEERWTDECHTGWWDDFIGPGKALDTDSLFVVCINYLGGCYGSTGPCSIDPATGKRYGDAFPWISVSDIVDTQVALLQRLGVERLHAVVGVSLGGFMAMSLATRYPELAKNVITLGSGMRVTMMQRVLNFEQICAIVNDPHFQSGNYYDGVAPSRGLALARMIGHKTFVSLETLATRARREVRSRWPDFNAYHLTHPVESYLIHQGQKFVQRFDANTYLAMMGIWQNVDLLRDVGIEKFKHLFQKCTGQRHLLFSIDSDGCFPQEEQALAAQSLEACHVECRHITVHSNKGHDSFLLEPHLYSPYMRHFLFEGLNEGGRGHGSAHEANGANLATSEAV